MKRALWPWTILLMLSWVLLPAEALAKEVSLAWKKIDRAIGYELEIQNPETGALALHKMLRENHWKGELAYGFYVYRLRAIDKLKRAGAWGSDRPLVVMAAPAQPQSPKEGETIVLFDRRVPVTLRWKNGEGAREYKIVVRAGEKIIYESKVADTKLNFTLPDGAGPGEYVWSVSPIVDAPARAPAGLQGRSWVSESVEPQPFRIEVKDLGRPIPVSPRGKIPSPNGGKLEFKWRSVEGAEAYEVRLAEGKLGRSKTYIVEDTSVKLPVGPQGDYRWEVRALANRDEQKVAGAIGPESVSHFVVDPNAKYLDGTGYVALSTMLAPYSYSLSSGATHTQASFNSISTTARLSGEYWLSSQWGAYAGFSETVFTVLSQNISRFDLEAGAKYRINLDESPRPWTLMPKAGLEVRQFRELRPTLVGQGFSEASPVATGMAVGVDIRKQFSPVFSLGAKFSYFHPILLSGVRGSLGGSDDDRNMSFGLQGLYWFAKNWGVGAGVYLENRSLSYSDGATGGFQDLRMDGTYFFGSLIYSFGR